ncbi:MAG TPA: heavy metal-binding domain-containing protein [Candidatus Poseidoniales archaeon]|nr:MAG: hypothetical protein CXX80_05710 [Euryarchaeota archaeon]HIA40484.1 heavy metal-binding domain-containing protein [Candidatus Poseidoniales archaeon]HIA90449.1 heavy metal-binding domain-containing protein [Candidatus Poseidoniales archaeon]HIB59226.1 heavy metal-binding domain-containing protein [Candidatus Poseidoniales archaeon]HIO94704.1 heavy metal-binding domain-containing protein [Candidatus Poseidoniales archaeon]
MAEDTITNILIWGFILASSLGPFLFSWLVGNWHQKRIIARLLERETALPRDNLSTLKTPLSDKTIANSQLLMANVVSAPSHWQLFLAGIKSIFGGNIKHLDQMLDWGRSEALQRLREQASELGYDDVINLRMETSTISMNKGGQQKGGSIEILAYGTGIKYL